MSHRVAQKIEEVNKTLPENVKITTLYDRTYLVDATLETVRKNLTEGAILVIVVLFLLLGNVRAAHASWPWPSRCRCSSPSPAWCKARSAAT